MKLWNPIAFFISLIMSIIMPLIFATPMGMPVEICFLMWPVRRVIAYFEIGRQGIRFQIRHENRIMESFGILHKPDNEFHNAIDIRCSDWTAAG